MNFFKDSKTTSDATCFLETNNGSETAQPVVLEVLLGSQTGTILNSLAGYVETGHFHSATIPAFRAGRKPVIVLADHPHSSIDYSGRCHACSLLCRVDLRNHRLFRWFLDRRGGGGSPILPVPVASTDAIAPHTHIPRDDNRERSLCRSESRRRCSTGNARSTLAQSEIRRAAVTAGRYPLFACRSLPRACGTQSVGHTRVAHHHMQLSGRVRHH